MKAKQKESTKTPQSAVTSKARYHHLFCKNLLCHKVFLLQKHFSVKCYNGLFMLTQIRHTAQTGQTHVQDSLKLRIWIFHLVSEVLKLRD